MLAGEPWARFDDLVAGTALRCPPPERVLVAERADQVRGVLAAVQEATDAGRWAYGYLAYEAAAGLDPGLEVHPDAGDGLPLAWFGICREPEPVAPLDAGAGEGGYAARWEPAWTAEQHRAAVAVVRERIAAGDTYQCNLTVRMTGRVDGDPLGLYRDLALRQRGAHNAYLDLGRFAVASASPELFVEVRDGGAVLLRPMKGTAPRGRHPAEDRRRAAELAASPKERAENLMIVDLLRNDVARVAGTGSVQVPALFTVESYPTVHQLTSDVTARLRPGTGMVELFTALFPSGSVTGAPKRSSMAVLRGLEPTPRGVYCGAVGWVGPPGAPVRVRFNVAIRTAVVDRATGAAVYGTGGGITWGSDAAAEHAELLAKAAVLGGAGGLPEVPELWETLRWDGTGLRNGERHLGRLAASAARLGLPLDAAAARALLARRLTGAPPARVRLRLARDGSLAVDVGPLPPPPAGPVRLALDDEPVDDADLLLFHKTSRREPYDRRRGRRPDADDVVLVNGRGELTEVTTANLAVRLDGRWWTPPVDSGLLPGVERGRLLETGELAERVLTAADLAAAEGVAVVNSLRGRRPAVVVDPLR